MNPLAIGFVFSLVSAALPSAPPLVDPTAGQAQEPVPSIPPEEPALAEVRELLEAARRAQAAKDYADACERIVAAIELAFARIGDREDRDATSLLWDLGRFAHDAGELRAAERARRAVLEVFARTLPADHPDLQRARLNLAVTMKALGDLHGARTLLEAVVEVFARTLPADHPDLQAARSNLALTLRALGDLYGARALEEAVLEVLSRTLPSDHPNLQAARSKLALTLRALGDLHAARALEEAVLEVLSRTLPADHRDLQKARQNLGVTILRLGDLHGARALFEAVLEVYARTLPTDHHDLQMARLNVAATMYALGDLHGARALFEAVAGVFARTLPDDHRDLQMARGNLALTIKALGDLQGARSLEEIVLGVFARTLPDDHDDLQTARLNLAGTMYALGDLHGARALFEALLEVFARTLPDDHPDLQLARGNLAVTIKLLGDFHGARSLEEAVLEVRARTLAADHPDLQMARASLAATMRELGDLHGALALEEAVLEVRARTLPADHPDVQAARENLAATIVRQFARASREEREGEQEKEEEREGWRTRCAELVDALCRSQVNAARAALLTSSVREAEERCAQLAKSLATALSFAEGYGVFDTLEGIGRESFVLSETTRGAALSSAAIARRAAGEPDYVFLRGELREASDALAALAQAGGTGKEYDRARTRREEAEKKLVALARELLGGEPAGLDFDVEALGAHLGERDAVVGFRRYTRWSIEAGAPSDVADEEALEAESVESLCAFVVRREGAEPADAASGTSLVIVPLGAFDGIEQAVRGWRAAIGARIDREVVLSDTAASEVRGIGVMSSAVASEAHARGADLRRLVWDPLVAELGKAERVIVAQDDVLHLVPLEALPLDATEEETGKERLVGDRWRIEMRVTLSELLSEPPWSDEGGVLVALGGASFNSEPVELAEADLIALAENDSKEAARKNAMVGLPRGGAWERGFSPLTNTGLEAREIAALHDELFEIETGALVLEKRKASHAALEELAPRARFLHVATHGWFAPESIASWSDMEQLDARNGLGMRLSGLEQVRGMSPMLLCGLALAGANLLENELGRVPGLVTAEELSTLDLSRCELAVLSACDTNVGERRAGQGVASLQKALQMAGARSVITSLWKVPDEATRELMLDFYRRIWVEKKPKAQALWEAKQEIRNAKDERGEPLYSTRDWAAWVLTGAPD